MLFFLQIDTVDNAELTPITSKLASVLTELVPGTKATGIVVDLSKIMGMQNIEEYYYYDVSTVKMKFQIFTLVSALGKFDCAQL